MNYVTLNGVKSTTIKGLLIQSLPFISKPLIRTEVEQIDGRDGDVTTKLGYSAYDKTMIIGLYGDYDVDDVIQYFDSKGIVTFSNEPDKYYKYEIIEQIDFERLIRFKTATVTFHVQPFKYSAVENTYTFDTSDVTSVSIRNNGNTVSRPTITINGSGTINLSVNGNQLFVINLTDTITIDSAEMNAYNGTQLLNRNVTGNYDNFVLNVGLNTVSWSGDVTSVEIENYSRWI